MPADKDGFQQKTIRTWNDFLRRVDALNRTSRKGWVYRGHAHQWSLKTTLERALWRWDIKLQHARANEIALVREFRRRLTGEEHTNAANDILYCLALMQHHGAPTRLLDCSYSPLVAVQFALRDGWKQTKPEIWCFNEDWLNQHYKRLFPAAGKSNDQDDRHKRFMRAYDLTSPSGFVMHDNPFALNQRLSIQQGVFLYPGNVNASFIKNLKSMGGWNLTTNIQKLRLNFSKREFLKAANKLKRMNLSSTAFFPGLDGFARSLGEELFFYNAVYGNDGFTTSR